MICSSCGSENETGRKFCAECGARLVSACPSCGASNAPTAKFCGDCGTTLVPSTPVPPVSTDAALSAAPSATERRRVSILFVDLVGFTALAAGLDPEEVRAIQDRYFATARSIVERYGGTVEKYIGDAVMSVWGAPVAHEDDAERAVRAALDLVDAVGSVRAGEGAPPLEARAAVMTGDAAVTLGATDQGIVSGDLVNSASRLQGVAPAGGVLVDEATRKASAEAIEFEGAGSHELRGLPEAIPAFRPLHVIAMRGGAGRSERLEPPFVGRDAELRLLKDLLHATAAERRARLVSITGIAGIGKSRLAWELEKYIDGIVEDIWWHQGRSPAYGDGVTFWALADMVRLRAGIAETDDADVARRRLATMLHEFADDEAEERRLGPAFGALLGLEDATGGGTEELFSAWRTLFERIARRGPVILVFEDLQWADSGLIDFVESVLEWSRAHPILVVTLARPELLERRPTWGAAQRNFSALHLEPLGDESIRALLAGLVPGLPRSLERRIVERAAGIPLFAVETVRMLLDDGSVVLEDGRGRAAGELDHLAVPDTLRALVGARLDGLDPGDRTLLQTASVLGQSFTIEGLMAITAEPIDRLEPRLRALVRRELLEQLTDPRSPERGQYAFVQAVIREVAYETLSKRDRRARHLDAARYFEGFGGDDLAGILASHYHDAYLATPDGPEADALAAQARVALRGAAERATALGSHDQALTYLEKSLTVTPEAAERAAAWEAASRSAFHAARFEAAETYGRLARDHYAAQRDEAGLARSAVLLVQPFLALARTSEALEVLESALAGCADESGEEDVVALEAQVARALMMNSDPRALEIVDHALAQAERLEIVPTIVDALVTKAAVLDYSGRTLEGLALVRGAIELAVAHRLGHVEYRARTNLAVTLFPDDPRAARAVAVEFRDRARALGIAEQLRWIVWVCVWLSLSLGDLEGALALVAELEEADLADLDPDSVLGTRALVAAYRGDAAEAARLRRAEEAVFQDVSRPEYIAGRHTEMAQIRALAGDLQAAFDEAMTAAGVVRSLFGPALAGRYALWIGDAARARRAWALAEAAVERGRYAGAIRRSLEAGLAALEGRRAEAAAGFRAATTTLRALDTPLDLALTQLDHAILVEPDDPDARAAATEAREIFTRLGMPPLLARLDEALARWEGAAPAVKQAAATETVATS